MQISDENVHHVREIMDEIFGVDNFMSQIVYRTSGSLSADIMSGIYDILIWYSKDHKKTKIKPLFIDRDQDSYQFVELPDKSRCPISGLGGNTPTGSRFYTTENLVSSGYTQTCIFPIEFEGKTYQPSSGKSCKTTKDGIEELKKQRRLQASGATVRYVLFYDDYPAMRLTNLWTDLAGASGKIYVVQTSQKVIQRCLLMTTDPGDLVFDPTCGSGTTAYAAEQWGRRWITCDTSRVAVTLAKQRLMTAKFDYYELAHPNEGVRSGFKYKTVPHVTLGSIANNEPAKEETLYDKPFVEKNKVRVTGPFTVEAVPSLRVKPFDGKEPKMEVKGNELARTGETGNQAQWRDELKATGIRTIGGKIIPFSRVEPMVATRFLHAEGEILEDGTTKKAYISFGPDYGPLEQRQIEEALKEARSLKAKPDFVVFAAFHFDPEAAKDVDQIEWKGVTILKAQMSVDLLTQDLRKKRSSNQSYWLIGQPDVEVKKIKDGRYKVIVNGFDYYDPVTGEIRSESNKQIAMWFLDTDYDERSLMPDQVFFPMSDSGRDWTKLAKALNGEVDEELIETFRATESLPFEPGNNRKIAVKIIDNRGIESFVVKRLE